MKFKKITYIFFTIYSMLLFTTCKKYPKNLLLLKRPAVVVERSKNNPWILEKYIVNDIDSTGLDFLQAYKKDGLIVERYQHQLFEEAVNSSHSFTTNTLIGYVFFGAKAKVMHFNFNDDNFFEYGNNHAYNTLQRNIFIKSGLNWKIDKLDKNNLWIITTYNNVKYELHFM